MAVIHLRGAKEAPRSDQSRMETLIITQAIVSDWRVPPFQRPLRVNDKVREVAHSIKTQEVIEGVITLGKLRGDNNLYIVDGQHRAEAFKMSAIAEALADVRICAFDSMAEMADEFVRLNSSLVKMRPDDILRGLESSTPVLQFIRSQCEFVGYDNIRRNEKAPMLGMSPLLRCWHAGRSEGLAPAGFSAAYLAQQIDKAQAEVLCQFLLTANAAWGRDPENNRLWANLNLAATLWLWNRLVIDRERSGGRRYAVLNIAEFKQCLMALSADENYVSWLVGRNLSDRDRSPCYARIKSIFAKRLADGRNSKVVLPAPVWAANAKI